MAPPATPGASPTHTIRRELGLWTEGYALTEYTSMIFVADQAVITYDVVPAPGCALKLRVLPVSWFYENG